ncbi:hypothetical protein KY290_018528 [Solanum tuberosum]|uniref:Uncharacterized protein n=1 Tax=Solanum tuberosum TaxID=4113 RepID=A0ABQ7VEG3_SOLTU|nr:hypothetical protein KY289_017649 [Solanum tuberosum]KAH0762455.1 hypothetical protein KY290_018528 [Solanum tuberosum]
MEQMWNHFKEKKKGRTVGYDEASILSKKIGEVKKRKARGLGSDHCTGCIMYGFIAAFLDSSQNQEEIVNLLLCYLIHGSLFFHEYECMNNSVAEEKNFYYQSVKTTIMKEFILL